MSRENHNAEVLYLRWAAVLASWMVCESTDKGAIKFVRAELPPKPSKRYWTVTLEGKIIGDPLGQYGMLSVCVFAETPQEAEQIAMEQEKESATEIKVLMTKPS